MNACGIHTVAAAAPPGQRAHREQLTVRCARHQHHKAAVNGGGRKPLVVFEGTFEGKWTFYKSFDCAPACGRQATCEAAAAAPAPAETAAKPDSSRAAAAAPAEPAAKPDSSQAAAAAPAEPAAKKPGLAEEIRKFIFSIGPTIVKLGLTLLGSNDNNAE
ncbi:hypothetical protein ABPG77_003073 [Micractinium sp. CCAP 211/92]